MFSLSVLYILICFYVLIFLVQMQQTKNVVCVHRISYVSRLYWGILDHLCRYKEGWSLSMNENRLYLAWKEQVVLCATAWKPIASPSLEP